VKSVKNRWLIAASALGLHLSIGAVYAYSVFKKPLLATLGWEEGATTWAFSLAILFLGLSAAFLGPTVERLGPRKSGMLSTLFYGGGLVAAGVAVSTAQLWLFYLGYGVIGGIGLGIGYIAPVSTLVKWFPDRRGFATGMAVMGFGFGALIASSLVQILIHHIGVAGTFYVLGGLYLPLMLTSARYLEPPPVGWSPGAKGHTTPSPASACTCTRSIPVAEVRPLRTVRFYYLWLILFINVTCGIAVIAAAAPMAQEIAGMSTAAATAMVGLMGLFNGLGRLGWATVSDYLGRPVTFAAFFVLQIGAFLLLPRCDNPLLFQAMVFLVVSCYGGGFAAIPAYISDYFGNQNLSATLGKLLTAWAAAGLFGPLLAAHIRATTGSYEQTLQIFVGLFVIALVASVFMQVYLRTPRALAAQVA